MGLWNNAIGRKLAKKNRTKASLAKAIKEALSKGELIIKPSDKRHYQDADNYKPDADTSVIVIKESQAGANETFFDLMTARLMTRDEFVEAIASNQYPAYEIRIIDGIKTPVSKRDGSLLNNLG